MLSEMYCWVKHGYRKYICLLNVNNHCQAALQRQAGLGSLPLSWDMPASFPSLHRSWLLGLLIVCPSDEQKKIKRHSSLFPLLS